ncbi:MAG: hypothetical protein QG633_374 [Patescibacteria group bacterium]|jgi:hypothetical protein|nr:hypothetical protein [Patescibacteria group bacterium]
MKVAKLIVVVCKAGIFGVLVWFAALLLAAVNSTPTVAQQNRFDREMPSNILYVEDEVGLCWAHFFKYGQWVDVEPIACTPRVLAHLDKHGSPLR